MKLKAGKIIFGEEGTANKAPFLRHQGQGNGHVMMACHSATEAELATSEGEPSTDDMTQRVQNSFKFRIFYDQMDFNSEQRLAITKIILELTDPTGDINLADCNAEKEANRGH